MIWEGDFFFWLGLCKKSQGDFFLGVRLHYHQKKEGLNKKTHHDSFLHEKLCEHPFWTEKTVLKGLLFLGSISCEEAGTLEHSQGISLWLAQGHHFSLKLFGTTNLSRG